MQLFVHSGHPIGRSICSTYKPAWNGWRACAIISTQSPRISGGRAPSPLFIVFIIDLKPCHTYISWWESVSNGQYTLDGIPIGFLVLSLEHIRHVKARYIAKIRGWSSVSRVDCNVFSVSSIHMLLFGTNSNPSTERLSHRSEFIVLYLSKP